MSKYQCPPFPSRSIFLSSSSRKLFSAGKEVVVAKRKSGGTWGVESTSNTLRTAQLKFAANPDRVASHTMRRKECVHRVTPT